MGSKEILRPHVALLDTLSYRLGIPGVAEHLPEGEQVGFQFVLSASPPARRGLVVLQKVLVLVGDCAQYGCDRGRTAWAPQGPP